MNLAPTASSRVRRLALETNDFFHRVVIEVRFAVRRKPNGATRRLVVMQRTRVAPDVISGRRHSDAALEDKRLLNLRVLMKGDVRARFEPQCWPVTPPGLCARIPTRTG